MYINIWQSKHNDKHISADASDYEDAMVQIEEGCKGWTYLYTIIDEGDKLEKHDMAQEAHDHAREAHAELMDEYRARDSFNYRNL